MAEERNTVQLAKSVRTRDDKVFFAGEAQVDERTEKAIEQAQEDAARKTRSMEVEEVVDVNELGDTRTSTEEKRAAKAAPRTGAKKAAKKRGK